MFRDFLIAGHSLSNLDVAFLLDSSESVMPDDFKLMLDFVKDLVLETNSESVSFAVITYSNFACVQFYLDDCQTREETLNAIDDIMQIRGSTNISDALNLMHTKVFDKRRGDRPHFGNIAILITDGESDSPLNTTIEAKKARDKGIDIYAIGEF